MCTSEYRRALALFYYCRLKFCVVVFIPFLSLPSFFFIEAAAKPSAFVGKSRGVCVFCCTRFAIAHPGIYIYTPLDESYARFAVDRWLPLPPPTGRTGSPLYGQYQKGVCRQETWPTQPATRNTQSEELFFSLAETINSNKGAVKRFKTRVVKENKELRGQTDLPVVLHWGYIVARQPNDESITDSQLLKIFLLNYETRRTMLKAGALTCRLGRWLSTRISCHSGIDLALKVPLNVIETFPGKLTRNNQQGKKPSSL